MNIMNKYIKETEAVSLFLSFFKNLTESDIKVIEKIKEGFTNKCYYFETTKNKKYLVRIGNKKVSRINEKIFIDLTKNKDYLYYDSSSGNAIKKWIKGYNPSVEECRLDKNFHRICKVIKSFQKVPFQKISRMSTKNYYEFLDVAKIEQKYKDKYIEIIEKHKNDKMVLSHNDIRPSNILICKNSIKLIDFEWSTLNFEYWDLANFMREIDYPLEEIGNVINENFKTFDPLTLKDFLFATTCYALQWTYFIV